MLPTSSGDSTKPAEPVEARHWLRWYDVNVPPRINYPRIPIFQLLDDTAAKYPDRTFAIFFGQRFTYQQFKQLSDRFAAGLQRIGIQPGDRVALLLPNSPQYIIAYYGVLKAGAVVLPLNPLYTESELTYHLTDSEAKAIITLPMFLAKVEALRDKTLLKHVIVSRLADFLPLPLNLVQRVKEALLMRATRKSDCVDFKTLLDNPKAVFTPLRLDPDSLAVLIYSGGTTGTAKGIMLSHFQCVANAHQVVTWGALGHEDRLLAVLPLFHGFGMSVTMNAPALAGGEVVLMPRFNAKAVLKAIEKFRPTFFVGVPTMFVALNNIPGIERCDLSSLKGVFVGAAPLTHAIKNDFEAKTSGRMIEGYGLTEVVTAVMANPYHGKHKIGSIGIPFPDVDAKIISLEDGLDQPPGEPGEILLRSPTLMLGYYKNHADTQAAVVDGWLHTGDVGYMDEDGFFYLTDRKKELIIVGGFNVFPREIDEVLYQHPKVKEGISVGIPDAAKSERIKVYVTLKDGETASQEELLAHFRERLTAYKVPSEVEFRTDLPKSMIGKILRRSLREEEIRKLQKPEL